MSARYPDTSLGPTGVTPASSVGGVREQRERQVAPLGVVLLLTGLLALVLAGCAVEDKARRLNREGNTAYDAGDYQAALDRYRQAQVEAPDDAAYIYHGGNALHRLGQMDRAITESQRASANGPDEVRFRAYYALGNHYVRQDRLAQARDAYKNALKINPGDMDAKFNLEVVQRRLDERQQQQQQQQQGQQQQGQNQQNQQGQQQGQQQQGQQQGQQQQGQQQHGQQQGQPQQGQQQGQQQSGQQQPGQQQQGQQQPGQGQGQQQPGNQQGQPTATAQELERQLRDAQAELERAPTVEAALRVLDILEQQQRLRQRQVPAQPPGNQRDQ